MSRLLVVEDDPDIAMALRLLLTRAGHQVAHAKDGRTGLRDAYTERPELVILDIGLPGMDGWQVLERLRDVSDVPVLLLTAHGQESDKVRGLRGGADDYLTKPFTNAELVARVEALLRRSGATHTEPSPFAFGPWQVDPASRSAARDGETVPLSAREVGLLALLARERGRIVSRRRLLTEVWGLRHADGVETRTVDVHIAKLRKKIGAGEREPIETVRGEGYRFVG